MTVAAMYYEITEEQIGRSAYNPRAALLRCCVLSAFLLVTFALGTAGADVPFDGGRLGLVLIPWVAIYIILAALAYRRDVIAAAQKNKWRRRPPRNR
ncbi:MAG: hypothetical protein ACK4K7_16035 [Allosphingosinicella sp.]|uniref:hypothetical protein n=1 Tax=Allosphingosinicella sp. TaxID=2823234 RepID=UPI00394FF648